MLAGRQIVPLMGPLITSYFLINYNICVDLTQEPALQPDSKPALQPGLKVDLTSEKKRKNGKTKKKQVI